MKALKNLSLLAVVAIVALLSSCSKTPEYTKLIPEDAVVVARVNTPKLLSNSSADDIKEFQKELKKTLDNGGFSSSFKETLNKLIEDPTASGIDVTSTFMAYVAVGKNNREEIAFLGEVKSSSDLTETLNALAKEEDMDKVQEKNGVNYMFFNSRDAIFFDGSSFIISEKRYSEDEDDFVRKMTNKFDTNGDGTFANTAGAKKLCGADGLFQMMVTGKGLKKATKEYGTMAAGVSGLDLEAADFFYEFSSEPGALTLTAEIVTEDEKWKDMIAKADDTLKDLSGDLCQYTPLDAFTMMANIDGSSIDEQIKSAGLYDMMDSRSADMTKEIVKSISGESSFSFTGICDGRNPEMVAYIGTKNNKIVDAITESVGDDAQQSGDKYIIASYTYDDDFNRIPEDYHYTYCFKNNYTALTASNNMEPFTKPSTTMPKDYLSGKKLYMYISCNFIKKFIKDIQLHLSSSEAASLDKFLSLFVDGEAYYAGGGKVEARINMKNRDKDALDVIGDVIDELGID